MRARTVDLGGPFHYVDYGGEGPPLVLVHGLGGSHLNWMAAGPALAAGARVFAPDLAGFGRTPPAGRRPDVHTNRRLLDRFLAEVVRAPAVLVGNSMGGLISLMEAAAAPERVAGLVLVSPAQPRAPGALPDLEIAAYFALYSIPVLGERFINWNNARLGPERLVEGTFRRCGVDPARVGPEILAAHVALAAERAREMPWANEAFLAAARSMLGALRPREFWPMAGRVRAPTLLLQGTRDRLVPREASRELARRRPDFAHEELEGLGHIPQLEDPARFLAAVSRWREGAGRGAFAAAA
jgi:pimeloyl-ACP methyl ester carboxylesterase